MDSMRSLNTSLPTASPSRRRRHQPPTEHLLQTFKQAALSVTNLYKAAASEHDKVYREGYQDALEDLLQFLDKEELGLQDGEGWRVRQWATERFEGGTSGAGHGSGESEDEEDQPVHQRRKASPEMERSAATLRSSPPANVRSESAPPVTSSQQDTQTTAPPPPPPTRTSNTPTTQTYTLPQGDFTFQSSHQYPAHDMDMDATTDTNGTVHINVVAPRPGRNTRQNTRGLARAGSSLGHGAGMKRRMPTFDFFDLGGFNGKDGFGGGGAGQGGGGKRGRFT